MTRYAQIIRSSGQIAALLDGDPTDWPDLVLAGVLRPCGEDVEPDWLWDGEGFHPPKPEVPAEVASWKGEIVLARMGLLAAVQAAVASANPEVAIAWSRAATWSRHGVIVTSLAQKMGLSDEQLDAMFVAANAIEG